MKRLLEISSLMLASVSALVLWSSHADAHARLKSSVEIVPRSTNAGIKTGPCGGLPRSANPPYVAPGSTITVTWEETIQHPGRFEFSYSTAGDANFVLLKTVPDTQDGTADLPHQYSTTLTIPSTPCSGCTIQMIQVMTENPANPTYYYSCSDITTMNTTGPTPTPGPQPTPIACPP